MSNVIPFPIVARPIPLSERMVRLDALMNHPDLPWNKPKPLVEVAFGEAMKNCSPETREFVKRDLAKVNAILAPRGIRVGDRA